LPDTIQHLPDTIQHLPDTIQHLPDTIQHLPDTIQHLDHETAQKLLQTALPISNAGKKASKAMIEETILALCEMDWLTLRTLAHLLDRKPEYLSNHYISRMLKDGRLETKIPEMLRHPEQAYRTKEANNHEL
jgi:ATP-dependent DNA helicase RecG